MGHDHAHGLRAESRRRLALVLGTTTAVMLVEVIGARVTGSLALLADAGHMLTDAAGLLIALIALGLASRPATPNRSFGYARLEILSALLNATVLFVVAILVLVEAWSRWQATPHIEAGLMLAFACVGAVTNTVGILVLRAGAKHSLNVRGAYLEVLGDLLGSLATIVSAIVILRTGWQRADVVASVLVACMIVPRALSLLRETVDILLEAAPKGVDVAEVRRHILEAPGVIDVHDLHAWTISSGLPVFSAHVVVDDGLADIGAAQRLLTHLATCLADNFALEHCTIQVELSAFAATEAHEHP